MTAVDVEAAEPEKMRICRAGEAEASCAHYGNVHSPRTAGSRHFPHP